MKKGYVLYICEKIIMLCMIMAPIIDSLTGYYSSTNSMESNISKLFRFFFLFVLFIVVMETAINKQMLQYLVLLIYIMLLPLIYSVINDSSEGIFTDTLYLSKLFFPLVFIEATKGLQRRGYSVERKGIKLLRYYSAIYPLLVFIPYLFGSGYKSYGQNGVRGFFGHGNEISIILGIMFIINVAFTSTKVTVANIAMTFISGFIAFMTASKAIYLIYGLFAIYLFARNKTISQVIKNFIVVFCLGVVSWGLFGRIFYKEIEAFVSRQLFRYEQLDRSFFNVLFSNRNQKIVPNFYRNYSGMIGIFSFMFGRGFYYQGIVQKKSSNIASVGLIEMDFFDMLLQNGIVIFLIVTIFYFRIVKMQYKDNQYRYFRFAYSIMLLFAFMAGHVLYNPMSSSVLALLGAILCCGNKKE